MKTVHAIDSNGIFQATEPVDLPDDCPVVFEPRVVNSDTATSPAMAKVYEIMSRTYETDDPGLSARHDEHQP